MRWMLVMCAVAALATNAASQPLPDDVRSAGVTAQEYNEEIETIRALANARGADARNALARLFAERARDALERDDYALAARYALGGWRVSPANEGAYRGVLGVLLHTVTDSRQLSGGSHDEIARAFSPDGARIVLRSDDHAARIWDVSSGQQLAVLRGHTNIVYAATFSTDGDRVVTASADGSARIWDAASGLELHVLSGHTAPVRRAWFSQDGQVVLTASDDRTVRLWDTLTGQVSVVVQDTALIDVTELSPDRRWLVTTVSQGVAAQVTPRQRVARVWDAATGLLKVELSGHEREVVSAAFSPDSTRIVTASGDGTARVWDAVSGAELVALRGHEDGDFGPGVTGASFSSDGARILTRAKDGTARIWDAASGASIAVMRGDPRTTVRDAAFSPDGTLVVTSSNDAVARVWDASSGRALNELRGHAGDIQGAAFSPDGARLATVSTDGTTRIWSAASGREQIISRGDSTRLRNVARFSPDGARGLTSRNQGVHVWDAATGRELAILGRHRNRFVSDAAFSRDGARVAIAYADGVVEVHNLSSGQVTSMATQTVSVEGVAFSSDGSRVIGAARGGARVWDAATGRLTAQLGRAGPEPIWSAAFSPDDSMIAAARADDYGGVYIWDVATAQERMFLRGHRFGVLHIAFSRDGSRLVSTSSDNTARIWDVASGGALGVLRGHDRSVSGAAFSLDGALVATASSDGTVRIWDVASGREVTVLSRQESEVFSVEFSPDGTRVLTASGDGTTRIYDVARLVQPMGELARDTCRDLLQPFERRFTHEEILADPLIREVWLRGGRANRDVCEGVPGAPRLN